MEFITGAILSGFVYDMLKHQVSLTANNIKEHLQDWIINDSSIKIIEFELNKLQLSNELSELAIEGKINSSSELLSLLSKISKNTKDTVIQTHSGPGDNVAGNKTINYK